MTRGFVLLTLLPAFAGFAQTGREVRLETRSGHNSQVDIAAAAWSRDGRLAVTADHLGIVIAWDVSSGKVVRRFEGTQGATGSVAVILGWKMPRR